MDQPANIDALYDKAERLLEEAQPAAHRERNVAALELELQNVTVVQARMESYLPERKFATIVSRAVTSVPELLAATSRLLATPARLLAMKHGPRFSKSCTRCRASNTGWFSLP